MMTGKCGIISGGERDTLSGIDDCGLIIACDKGYEYARAAGVRPGLLIGDFDSYTGPLPEDIPRLDLPAEKDDTDTMAAVRHSSGLWRDKDILRPGRQGRSPVGQHTGTLLLRGAGRKGLHSGRLLPHRRDKKFCYFP